MGVEYILEETISCTMKKLFYVQWKKLFHYWENLLFYRWMLFIWAKDLWTDSQCKALSCPRVCLNDSVDFTHVWSFLPHVITYLVSQFTFHLSQSFMNSSAGIHCFFVWLVNTVSTLKAYLQGKPPSNAKERNNGIV